MPSSLLFVFGFMLIAPVCAQTWQPQTSGTTASLRGVSAVNPQVVWASGSGGTFLRTTDGGTTWRAAIVPGAEALDFRGIAAIDAATAYLMSIGPGDKSRILKTTDAGASWTTLFTNPDATGFFDAVAFPDANHGIVAGDQVDGRMTIFTTDDSGAHWQRQRTPSALPGEGAFAASNSCLLLRGKSEVWFATGGTTGGRVLHSKDSGRTWVAAPAPIRHDAASAGIFSLAFSDSRHGVAVGGDYAKDKEPQQNIVITSDGGQTWHAPPAGPAGYRSAVAWLADRKTWLATGTSGSDTAPANLSSWRTFDTTGYNAISAISSQAAWAVGPQGRIARLRMPLSLRQTR